MPESQYVPWYFKRSCPIFCWPCVPVYSGIWPARKFVLIIGAVFFAIGMLMLLGLLVTCVAVECSILAGALLPFALILILAGILIFHCGWAAHLLDYGGKVPSGESFTTKSRVTRYDRDTEVPEEDEPIFETVIAQEQPPIKVGHWQFDEKESWQAVANPYPIQSTLKPVIDRQTYSSL